MKKSYEVIITHSYLLEASNEQEAMKRSMDRFMGRIYKDVAFDGMVVNCEITDQCVPFSIEKKSKMTQVIGKDEYDIEPNINGDRTDSKEQDYLHFSAADEL